MPPLYSRVLSGQTQHGLSNRQCTIFIFIFLSPLALRAVVYVRTCRHTDKKTSQRERERGRTIVTSIGNNVGGVWSICVRPPAKCLILLLPISWCRFCLWSIISSCSSIAQLFCLFFGRHYMDAVPLATRQTATCQKILKSNGWNGRNLARAEIAKEIIVNVISIFSGYLGKGEFRKRRDREWARMQSQLNCR